MAYRWKRRAQGIQPEKSFEPILEGIAPDKAGEYRYVFYVIDGLRASESVKVKVIVAE